MCNDCGKYVRIEPLDVDEFNDINHIDVYCGNKSCNEDSDYISHKVYTKDGFFFWCGFCNLD